jgi:hypothetical protein
MNRVHGVDDSKVKKVVLSEIHCGLTGIQNKVLCCTFYVL